MNIHVKGLVLIEILITITIGLLLISILFEMYLVCQKSITLQTNIINIQNNANAAIAILTAEIQKAGTIGCAQLTEDFPIIPYFEYSINQKNKLMGNVHEIEVRYASYPNTVLNKSMDDYSVLNVGREVLFSPGDIVLISNCQRAELFAIKQVNLTRYSQKLITQMPLHNKYEKYSEVSKLAVNTYFVLKTNRRNPDGTNLYSLFVKDIKQREEELVENISQMTLAYSLIQAGNLEEVQVNKISDWSKVVGVAIDLAIYSNLIKKNWHMYLTLQRQ